LNNPVARLFHGWSPCSPAHLQEKGGNCRNGPLLALNYSLSDYLDGLMMMTAMRHARNHEPGILLLAHAW
jgi:hypothetical protein